MDKVSPKVEGLLTKINKHLKETGLTRTEFGRLCANDRSLISSLESGRDIRVSTLDQIEGFLNRNAPAATEAIPVENR